MRKYVLPLLGLYLDFVWINAIVVLADRLFPGIAETFLGQPMPVRAQTALSLILIGLARLTNASLGQRLLSYAWSEQPAGQRQWPNLLLGTAGFVSGIGQLKRLTGSGDVVPFLSMFEDTPLMIAAFALYAALYGWCGVALLRFAPGAKLFGALIFASSVLLAGIDFLFSRDVLIARMMMREASKGRPIPLERAEFFLSLSLLYTLVFSGILLVILLFCRERPTAALERPLEGSPGSPA
ncbi:MULTISPECIES: hypothetical protein [Mesorhizobium]|uniref:hypothetical protein n=1 Tax=Mesorhizobium TaxID=68287 RepID=UPI0010A94E79|nr:MULTISPECIES: hypothetical protein [Mesorhizobium]